MTPDQVPWFIAVPAAALAWGALAGVWWWERWGRDRGR